MYNSLTLCSTLLYTEDQKFFKGTCAPHSYGPVQ